MHEERLKLKTESDLISACISLIPDKSIFSQAEHRLVNGLDLSEPNYRDIKKIHQNIKKGYDPLGDAFSEIRSPASRRTTGAVYTPTNIIKSILRWLSHNADPVRIVDPGAGSGRFILQAAKTFPKAKLIAVESDPIAAIMLRANLAALGYDKRATVIVNDYRKVKLSKCKGVTAFIGNPPCVRHHKIEDCWKEWYLEKFSDYGIKASALAGLHLHFFLKTLMLGKEGDIGAFITSAEWMDVNYGDALRRLLLADLGGLALHVLKPSVEAFPGTATTAAITCFRIGKTETPLLVRSVESLSRLNGLSKGTNIPREHFHNEAKWSVIIRPSKPRFAGEIELGELFRVHRGQVTGANEVWISGNHSKGLPLSVLLPSVTKAKDIIAAGETLNNINNLKEVIDIPPSLDSFNRDERKNIETFLVWAKSRGADLNYIAKHRKAWWSVGLKAPAPILCTYMARRSPHFTLNICGARHINIAHGLYPLQELDKQMLAFLVKWLNQNISVSCGRTYAGGLIKFEPKELERLCIPPLEAFAQ